MKKMFLASALLVLSASSFAGTSQNLEIKGTVAAKVSLGLTAEAGIANLNLESSASDLLVATINEKSNTNFHVTVTSANAGKFKHATASQEIIYTMKYDGSSVALSSTGTDLAVHSNSGPISLLKAVRISYTGIPAEEMTIGEYKDTLTFAIATN